MRSLNLMSSVGFHASKAQINLENLLQSQFGSHFQAEKIPQSLLFFGFLIVVLYGLEESIKRVGSFDLMGFRVIDIQKCKKNFFFFFFFFFASLSRHCGVSTCKILTFPNFGVLSLTVTFEEQFLLIYTRYSPKILNLANCYQILRLVTSKPQKLYHLVRNYTITQEQFTLTCFGISKTLC